MKKLIYTLCLFTFCFVNTLAAQDIVYADINKEDVQRMNFEIIGKLANNYLIYKENKGRHRIDVFNENMQLLGTEPIGGLPKKSDLLDLTFYSFSNYAYMIYQVQRGNVVYCNAARIEPNGKILQEPVTLDTTIIAYKAEGRINSSVKSAGGSSIMIFKINKKDRALHLFKTKLFDSDLNLISESSYGVPMEDRGDYLSNYSLANNGDFSFVKYNRLASGNIQKAALIIKPQQETEYKEYPIEIGELFFDDIKLKVDDLNKRYLLSSFYAGAKKGNMAGMYNAAFDITTREKLFETHNEFDREFRKKVAGKGNGKNAFDGMFINSIIVHRDGGFSIAAEELHTSNAGGWDRWGFWGGPGFYGPYGGMWGGFGWGGGWGWGRGIWSPYGYYSPFFYRSYWWGPGFGYGSGYSSFHAGNLAVFSYDKSGNRTTENILFKNQTASQTDGTISYQVLLNNDKMHFFLNQPGKISDLDEIVITESGQMTEMEPIEAKDKNIDFMPRYGKQVGPGTMLIPYITKKNISFVKVTI